MRIKPIVTTCLLLIAFTTVAQKKKDLNADEENFFRFGGKAGVNINKINGNSYKSSFNYNYQLGGFVQFNFSDRFGVQPEINFVQASAELTEEASDIYYDLFLDGSQKSAKLNYLEIPVLLNINVGESKHVKLQLGPAYGGLLKETIDGIKEDTNIFKKGEWSAIGGLWIQLPLVNIGGRYKLGLTDVNNTPHEDLNGKSQSIQIFIGLTF